MDSGLRQVQFEGVLSSDSECFCWDSVPEEHKKLIDETGYEWAIEQLKELDEEEKKWMQSAYEKDLTRLYPGDIFSYLNCQRDKHYKFTISVEEIPSGL